jgi:hypothetical protein
LNGKTRPVFQAEANACHGRRIVAEVKRMLLPAAPAVAGGRRGRTATAVSDLETYYAFYQHREPEVQRFEVIEDYQAETWSRPRRIVAKIEINRHGVNRRFVVTNLSGDGRGIYHGFYVQRGNVPEKPIGELKNGLQMDRLSFHRFRANGLKLLEHTLAYALDRSARLPHERAEQCGRCPGIFSGWALPGRWFRAQAIVLGRPLSLSA